MPFAVGEDEGEIGPRLNFLGSQLFEGGEDELVFAADLGPDFVEECSEADSGSDRVPGANESALANVDGELGEIGNVDPLHGLVEDIGDENFVELIEAGDPVGESARVVVGSEYDAGPYDAKGIGKGFPENFFTSDFEGSVRCGGHFGSLFAVGNLGLLSERDLGVFDVIDADGGNEGEVPGAELCGGTSLVGIVAGDVDDFIPFLGVGEGKVGVSVA